MSGGLPFYYQALVFVFPPDTDTPEVVYEESMTKSLTCSLSDVDAVWQIADQFETDNLAPGVYEVWIEGEVVFSTYSGPDGTDYDQDVHIEKQEWTLADQNTVDKFCIPDVDPVMVFWSSSPVPEPDWTLHSLGYPILGPDDAEATHNVWTRVTEDGKTLYQLSAIGEKVPTLRDGAYYDLHPFLLLKGLYHKLIIEKA